MGSWSAYVHSHTQSLCTKELVYCFEWFVLIRGLDNLEGAQTEFDANPQAHIEVVWEKTEHHVMSAEERDKQKGGLGQSPEEKR